MQPLAPNSTVWAGMPDRWMTASQAATSLALRAIVAATVARVQASVSVALTAAITSGLPLYVPRWSTSPVVMRFMYSALPPNAPTGKPPPIDLASAIRSGCTPK